MTAHTRRDDPRALVDDQLLLARRRNESFRRRHDGDNRARDQIERLI